MVGCGRTDTDSIEHFLPSSPILTPLEAAGEGDFDVARSLQFQGGMAGA